MADHTYTSRQLVRVAKRENNKKRGYLVVNPLQGKHVPANPAQALEMMGELGQVVKQAYPGEKLLAVGFAETATAIGAEVAAKLSCSYIQTTREELDNVTFLHFSEEHSHATCQKLVGEDVETALHNIDRIVFVEDEVTTGNTILNIVDVLEKEFGESFSFGVASLLNGMDEKAMEHYRRRNIPVHFLVKTNHEKFEELANEYGGDGVYKVNLGTEDLTLSKNVSIHTVFGYENTRRLVSASHYQASCEALHKQVSALLTPAVKNVLVLGTEEFMYPPLYVARELQRLGKNVKFHATTRSPILVSSQQEYVLHARYQLSSLYEKGRVTFVYDLEAYDIVLVITDTAQELSAAHQGVRDLVWALQDAGNENIQFICWREEHA